MTKVKSRCRMDSESSTPQGAAASATDAFSLTQAAVTAFQSEFQSFQPSKMQVSKLVEEEDEFVPLGLGTLLESLTLQDQASVSRQAAYEESLPFRVRCVSCSLNLSPRDPPLDVSNRWVRVRRVRQRDDDSDSDTTHDSMPELVSDGEDEPDDDSVTHESMPELARQSDDEREPNDDDNEDQAQSQNVLPIHLQIGAVIQEMGYVPCGDLNEVDTTTEDDEEEDECEVQTEPKVQTEPIWIGHDE